MRYARMTPYLTISTLAANSGTRESEKTRRSRLYDSARPADFGYVRNCFETD
jgi:hypothetical protein